MFIQLFKHSSYVSPPYRYKTVALRNTRRNKIVGIFVLHFVVESSVFPNASDKAFAFSEAVLAQVPSSRFKGGITSALPPKDIKDLEIFHHSREEGFNFDNFALVRRIKPLYASNKPLVQTSRFVINKSVPQAARFSRISRRQLSSSHWCSDLSSIIVFRGMYLTIYSNNRSSKRLALPSASPGRISAAQT